MSGWSRSASVNTMFRFAVLPLVVLALVGNGTAAATTDDADGWFEVHSNLDEGASAHADIDASVDAGRSARGHSQDDTAHPLTRRKLDLFVGEVHVIGPVTVDRVAIGNGQILRAEVLDTDELMIIGEAAGSSSIRLWHKDGRQSDVNVRVSETDPDTRFHMERMVNMKVRMVEFRKSALEKLGIDWGDQIDGPTLATAADVIGNPLFRPETDALAATLPSTVQPFTSYFGITSAIRSRIDLLQASGDAVTLAEPLLSCASGGSASFLAGGEVPYPAVDSSGRTVVQFKEYGVRLDVSPRIDSAGNVQTVIDTEISQLDPAVSVQGTPGLLTRRASTAVNVRSGQTIVVSGLLTSDRGDDAQSLPGLARIPWLGRLFSTRQRRSAVTELVIFVTPEIIDPAQPIATRSQRMVYGDGSRLLERARDRLHEDR